MALARSLLAVLALLLLAGTSGTAAGSGWDRLKGLVVTVDRSEPQTVEGVARFMAGISEAGETPLAAAATEVGHWTLANTAGEVFTASGSVELAQAMRTLAAEAASRPEMIRFYLTADSLFRHAAHLAALPAGANLSVVIDGRALPVRRIAAGDRSRYLIGAGTGVLIEAGRREVFEELVWQLRRPVRRSKVRTLALEPGGLTLPGVAPEVDPGTRRARPDAVDPGHAGGALRSLSGQFVLLSGSLDGDRLTFKPAKGAEGSIRLGDLWKAAAEADANVIALSASSSRQPGSRNWLWQRVGLATADKAVGAETLGQFLHVLAGEARELVLVATATSPDRIEIDGALWPRAGGTAGSPFTESVRGTWSDIVSETAGSLTVLGLKASFTRAARQGELDQRIVPFVPSLAQFGYLAMLAAGLFAWRRLVRWWRWVWPDEDARDYGSGLGVGLARMARWGVFILLFLPLAALPAIAALLADATARLKTRLFAPRGGNLSPS